MDTHETPPPQAGRAEVGNALDPRAVRTREAIFGGIERLVSESVAEVSVGDVVRASGVSRSSFYAHFTGLEDVALAYLTRQLQIIGDAGIGVRREDLIVGAAAAKVGYSRLVTHIVHHFPLYSTVLALPATRGAFHKAIEVYSTTLMRSVMLLEIVPEDVNIEVAAAYAAGGALTVISAWIRGELDLDDDALVLQLVDLLPDWVRNDHPEESKSELL